MPGGVDKAHIVSSSCIGQNYRAILTIAQYKHQFYCYFYREQNPRGKTQNNYEK
jgi:hypothetical protein